MIGRAPIGCSVECWRGAINGCAMSGISTEPHSRLPMQNECSLQIASRL